MINELDRLIDKYSSPSWNTQAIAKGHEERTRLDTVEGRNLQEVDEAKDMEYFMALEKRMADMKRSEWQALYSANKNK